MAKKKNNDRRGRPKRPAKRPEKQRDLPELPDRRLMERAMRQMFGAGGAAADTPQGRAQELIDQALEAYDPRRREALAREALAAWPDAVEAYVILAEQAGSDRAALPLFEQAVAAGERALGAATFRDDVGHFWGILETRPYMRAREGLAVSLWSVGRRDEAIGHLKELLRLNPNDNQGVRYTLAGWLANLGRNDELQALLDAFPDDGMSAWAYHRALLAYRQDGDTARSRTYLKAALMRNKHVPAYVLGETPFPPERPTFHGLGDVNEAIFCAADAIGAWKSTPGALAWMRATMTPAKGRKEQAAAGPTPALQRRLARLSQQEEVWQAIVGEFPAWYVEDNERFRPWVVLVVSQTAGVVLAHTIVKDPPLAEALWDVLAAAMQDPADAAPRRPTVLQVRDAPTWQALRFALAALGIRLEVADELDVADDALVSLFDHVRAESEPALSETPGITPAMMRGFYEAAADYYRAAPWQKVAFDMVVQIESDQFAGGPWYAVIMGQSGMTFGLSLYEDKELLMRTMSGELSEQENAEETVALTVIYDEATQLPVADVDAVKQLALPVAGPQAFPGPFKKDRGMTMRPPEPSELQLLEASLRAIPAYARSHPALQPTPADRTEATVATAAGPVKLTLSWMRGVYED